MRSQRLEEPSEFGIYACTSMGLVLVVVVIIFSLKRGVGVQSVSESARPGDKPEAGFTQSCRNHNLTLGNRTGTIGSLRMERKV